MTGTAIELTDSLDETTSSEELPWTERFDLLSNERRIAVLRYLREIEQEADIGDVVDQATAWETDKPVAQITGDERHRVYTSLRQTHLPKLDQTDVIAFDKQRGTVEVGEHFESVYGALETSLEGSRTADDEASRPSAGWYQLAGITVGLGFIAGVLVTDSLPSLGLQYGRVAVGFVLLLGAVVTQQMFVSAYDVDWSVEVSTREE